MGKRAISVLTSDPERLRTVLDALRSRGFDVLSMPVATSAIRRLEKYRPDVVLVENFSNGSLIRDLCQSLSSHEPTEDTAVIVLSDETNREEEFFQAGVRDVLPRGVDDRRLIARIHVQLRLKDRIDGLKQLGGPSQVIGEPKDNLTKLSLFPEMERRIEAEIARATTNHPFSCCLIHLDQFIWVNLHRGYMSGDVLLLELARLLRESLPPAGLAARFSAGQLALVLTDATRAQAQTWAEQFRDKVREYPFTGVDIGQAITVSIGMVTFPEEQSDRGDALLHLLVQRTELAVAQGGNCIVGSSL